MKLMRLFFIGISAMFISASAFAEELRVGLKSEPSSIDPHYHNLGPNNAFATHIFSSLVGSDENQQHYPDLAVSWEPINDTTWEFKLRKGVKWHDGSDFTADDVIFTVERAQNVPNSPSSFVTYLKGKTFENPKSAILAFTGPGMFTNAVRQIVHEEGRLEGAQAGVNFNGCGIPWMQGSEVRYHLSPPYVLAKNDIIVN